MLRFALLLLSSTIYDGPLSMYFMCFVDYDEQGITTTHSARISQYERETEVPEKDKRIKGSEGCNFCLIKDRIR